LNIDLKKPSASKEGKCISEYVFKEADVRNLSFIESGSCSEVRANDILDHIYYLELPNVLKEWTRVLKRDGILKIYNIPDFEIAYMKYLNKRTVNEWIELNKIVDMLSYKEERYRSKNIIDRKILSILLEENDMIEINYSKNENDINLEYKKVK